jgi:hypothetical protein
MMIMMVRLWDTWELLTVFRAEAAQATWYLLHPYTQARTRDNVASGWLQGVEVLLSTFQRFL